MGALKVGDRVRTPYDTGEIIDFRQEGEIAIVRHDTWSEGHNMGTDWDKKPLVGRRCWLFMLEHLAKEDKPCQ